MKTLDLNILRATVQNWANTWKRDLDGFTRDRDNALKKGDTIAFLYQGQIEYLAYMLHRAAGAGFLPKED